MEILETRYLYLILLLFTAFFPLVGSWESKIRFRTKWKAILISCFLMMLVFIPWDIWFAKKQVWWFNHNYTLGIDVLNLPIEEWLFFVIIPFACIFIYESLNYFFPKDYFKAIAPILFGTISVILLVSGLIYIQQIYTAVTFISTAVFTALLAYTKPPWIGKFLFMYLVVWIPFIAVNGALTGSFTTEAVVNYDPAEIIGLRIFSIPIEDSVYNLLMLGLVMFSYQKLTNRN